MSGLEMSSLEDWEVLDLLTSLVDKSLVVYEEQPDGTGRYRLLETVRQYAGDRLADSGAAEAVGGRAAACFLALAEETEPQFRGFEQGAWLSRLEAEHDNLRASLSWNLSFEEHLQGGRSNEDGLRLAGSLWGFWRARGHLSEGRRWLAFALARASGGEASVARAEALRGACVLAGNQGDDAEALALAEESLTLSRQLGYQSGIAWALLNLSQGDDPEARASLEESLTLFRQLEDQSGIAWVLMNLGDSSSAQGDHAGARMLYEESLVLFRQSGHQWGIAMVLVELGNVASVQGDYAGARALLEESLTISRQLRDQMSIAFVLEGMAQIANRNSLPSRAAWLLGAACSLRDSIGTTLAPAEQEETDKTLASAAEALGEEAFAAAWDAGRAMTMEQAVEYALFPASS